jgi:hypothetical protein
MSKPQQGRAARDFTLVLTNVIKLAGLIIFLKEVLAPTLGPDRAEILAIAAFMMAGAQLSESLLLSMMDRLLGRPSDLMETETQTKSEEQGQKGHEE